MNVLITGRTGTLGPVLAAYLQEQGHHPIGWDRGSASPLDLAEHAAYIDSIEPDALFHLGIAAQSTGADNEGWRVNVEWSEHLARLAAERDIPFVFTSTALVFNNDVSGPFTPESRPNADEGYGQDKRIAEERVRAANPNARIVRLGWQIGDKPEGNNMLAFAEQKQREWGSIGASTRWYPACSFLTETARALVRTLDMPPGTYMADSNRGHTFYEILCALRQHFGFDWQVHPKEDYIYDQRLIDPRLVLSPLTDRLPTLRPLP